MLDPLKSPRDGSHLEPIQPPPNTGSWHPRVSGGPRSQELEGRLPFETKRTDDEIGAAAIERLAWDTSVPTDAVKLRVEKGWLTLTGQVDWKYQKDAAHDDIRPLSGVVGISDQPASRQVP